MRMSEADAIAHATRHGLPLDAALTLPGLPKETPEGTLLAKIRALAKASGWLFHHVLDSRGCEYGFPDICAVKPGHPVILAELKTRTGKLTREQMLWMEFLSKSTGIESYVWRPGDFNNIVQILTRT